MKVYKRHLYNGISYKLLSPVAAKIILCVVKADFSQGFRTLCKNSSNVSLGFKVVIFWFSFIKEHRTSGILTLLLVLSSYWQLLKSELLFSVTALYHLTMQISCFSTSVFLNELYVLFWLAFSVQNL